MYVMAQWQSAGYKILSVFKNTKRVPLKLMGTGDCGFKSHSRALLQQ